MGGFVVKETIDSPPEQVWACLTNFDLAHEWMTGLDQMRQVSEGPVSVGSRFKFLARGKERETEVTALQPGRQIALTSIQGGVRATYTYTLTPVEGGTEATLNAVCRASGFWKLLHPIIVFAMKKSDSTHLTRLKHVIANRSRSPTGT